MALGKGFFINKNGRLYTNENIDRLNGASYSESLRKASSKNIKGKRTHEDD